MADPQEKSPYLSVDELAAHTGLSTATIWRLKKAGKIPFFQPGGKSGRVKFPANAIELVAKPNESTPQAPVEINKPERLPGPRPKWMSPSEPHTKPK